MRPLILARTVVWLLIVFLGSTSGDRKCASNVCFNGGTCLVDDDAGIFQCECVAGFTGTLCESAIECSLSCRNGGMCAFDERGLEHCECPEGFSGDLCTSSTDCQSTGCVAGEVCLFEPASNQWTCSVNLCEQDNPCEHNATCRPTLTSFICECPIGYRGRTCQLDIDECIRNPSPCQNNGTCINTEGGFNCDCSVGFNGKLCEQRIGFCVQNPCGTRGQCLELQNGFECNCFAGFQGATCDEVVDTCVCENPAHVCTVSINGTPECACPPGTTGADCSEAVDLCRDANPCINGGQCIANGNQTFCICSSEFVGDHCEKRVPTTTPEPCLVEGKPCLNDGQCIASTPEPICQCVGRFTGKWCEALSMTPTLSTQTSCEPGHCRNDGTCSMIAGRPVCNCPETFTGPRCEERVAVRTPCDPNPCLNDGNCNLGVDNDAVSCFCLESFTGERCQIPCNCGPNELCRESQTTPGTAECVSVPEPEVVVPEDSTSDKVPSTTPEATTLSPVKTTTARANTFPSPPFLANSTTAKPSTHTTTSISGVIDADDLLNVSSCDACVHAHRCVEVSNRFVCLCQADFTGAFCDQPFTACATQKCNSTETCRLHRTAADDVAECACPPGKFGANCAIETTANLKQSSVVLHQKPLASGDQKTYELTFDFKTTVGDVHLASGEGVVGERLFQLDLVDGELHAILGNQPVRVLEMQLNDGEWYTVKFRSRSAKSAVVEVEDSASGFILARKLLTAQRPLSVLSTRFGKGTTEGSFFIGCLRDAFVDGGIVDLLSGERAIDVSPGCSRRNPCGETTCQNGATCVDLWDDYRCACVRPFLEPVCTNSLREATFGHAEQKSFFEVAVRGEEAQDIRQKTDLSFLLRTNEPNGVVAFVGNQTDDEDSVSTFIGVQVVDGKIRVDGKLGGRRSTSTTGTARVDDNVPHLVEVQRVGNNLRLRVDGKADGAIDFKHPFDHPLLADTLVLGDRANIKQPSFAPDGHFYRGTLQDVRLNGKSVVLTEDRLAFEVETFGERQLDQNVLAGTVSDDVCKQAKPCSHGACRNTFNDYECTCEDGWIGRNCSMRDHCAAKPCPAAATCVNSHGGFVCQSTASLYSTSFVRYTIRHPDVLPAPQTTANFTFDLRTRSTDVHVIKLQSRAESLSFLLTDNGVVFDYSNATSASVDPLAVQVNDGAWHSVVVQEADRHLTVTFDSMPPVPLLAFFSLTRFLADKNARVFVGRSGKEDGFVGCLRSLTFSDIPELSFFVDPADHSVFNDTTHFTAIQIEAVRPDGCRSREVCGAFNPCKNGAVCADLFNARECRCPAGFEGPLCEININDCSPGVCGNFGRCVDKIASIGCQCARGFSGDRCQVAADVCRAPGGCLNSGTCIDNHNGTFACQCGNELVGRRCQQKRNVGCDSRPCENGGTCSENDDGFRCTCAPGFEGSLCEDRTDHCALLPCANGGTCVLSPTNDSFTCECPPAFTGLTCTDFADLCTPTPGTTACAHGNCRNVFGDVICECESGWTGPRCDIDIDECSEFPCANNGTCTNTAGGFDCECAPFYLGETCEIAGPCAEQPCLHGTCLQHSVTDYACSCDKGFRGKHCDEQIDYCADHPCLNGATCNKLVGGFTCTCIPGFTDETCSTDIDDCVPGSCLNNGQCIDRVNGFDCNCTDTGFRGPQCTEDVDECHALVVSSFCINGACTNLPGSYRCDCEDGFIGAKCNMVNPCLPDPLNQTLHNCVHGTCARPVVVELASGRSVAQHDCDCFEGFAGPQCTHRVEQQYTVALSYILGPIGAVLVVLCLLGCLLFFFVARNKRANQGHYSPSHHEQLGISGLGSSASGGRLQSVADVHHGGPKGPATRQKVQPVRTGSHLKQPLDEMML